MTIRGVFREFVAAQQQQRDRHDERVWAVWHTVAWAHGSKGLPKLDTLLANKPSARAQTPKEQVEMWKLIAARLGGEFRPVDPRTVSLNG